MKIARLSALSAAILMIPTAQGNAFVDDASLDIHLRNYYKNQGVKNSAPDGKDDSHSQWAQAVRIDFSSGYFHNLIGIDLGIYHSLKLRGDKNSNNLMLLSPAGNGNVYGFGKTAYAIKVNLMDMGVAKYGRMFIDTPLLGHEDDSTLPMLQEGFYAEGTFNAFGLYGIVVHKNNPQSQSGFYDYGYKDADNNSDKKNSVQIIGATYDFGHGFSTHLAYGKQKESYKRYYGTVDYTTNINGVNLNAGIQYGKVKEIGLEEEASEAVDWDTSTNTWGAFANIGLGAASIGLAYTSVKKSTFDEDGEYLSDWTTNRFDRTYGDGTGFFGYNNSQYSDFNRGGQKAWGIRTSYNLNDFIEGLTLHGTYVTGKVHPDGNDSWNEKEYNLEASYQLPFLEGLSAHVMYAHNTQEDQGNDENGGSKNLIYTDTRIIVKYDIAVF